MNFILYYISTEHMCGLYYWVMYKCDVYTSMDVVYCSMDVNSKMSSVVRWSERLGGIIAAI